MNKQIKQPRKEKTRNKSPGDILENLMKLDNTLYQDELLAGQLVSNGVLAKAIADALLAHKEEYLKGNWS